MKKDSPLTCTIWFNSNFASRVIFSAFIVKVSILSVISGYDKSYTPGGTSYSRKLEG